MSQRASGWERKAFEQYETPEWCTEEAVRHLPHTKGVCWEPSCGSGKMVSVLERHFKKVIGTDIQEGDSFLDFKCAGEATTIFGNPPYNEAQAFIEHALRLMEPCLGQVAMLLRVDFDSAKTRQHLFAGHPAWAKKLVYLKRIMWFPGEKSPSYNHAVYYWNWRHEGPATIAYGPRE